MATFLPQTQIPPPPVRDLTAGTPPDQALLYPDNLAQRMQPSNMMNGGRAQNRTSDEYRGNGASGFASANGALPMPAGPHAHIANGGPRNIASMGVPGVFDGPRSPPNTKSTIPLPRRFWRIFMFSDGSGFRYLTRALQVLQVRAMSSRESLSLLTFYGFLDC